MMKKKSLRGEGILEFAGEKLRAVSFPLGGIGAGSVALCGDGGLRQWQIFNNVNHYAHVPLSFFGLYSRGGNSDPKCRVLQSNAGYDDQYEPAPSVSDHVVPRASRELLKTLPGVDDILFVGEYPVAEIFYALPGFPVSVSLRAYSPFVPLDADESGLPAVIFQFCISNPPSPRFVANSPLPPFAANPPSPPFSKGGEGGSKDSRGPVEVSILMCQQNAVGWDDSSEIDGVFHPSYGGNRNRIIRSPGLTAIELKNISLSDDHPRQGEMLIAALDDPASTRAQWTDVESLWADFCADGRLDDAEKSEPSPRGQTVNSAIACRRMIEPESEQKITFLLTWRFPNRFVEWEQPTLTQEQNVDKSKLWLGNHYAVRFGSALEVSEYVRDNLSRFDDIAARFRRALHDSSLPVPITEAISSQISVVRSPTCFRSADGNFYAFEGCQGASTETMGSRGGCCPLNCTHVWNYAMTVARLFPQLERSMRETEWLHQQHESGYLPHRVVVPLYLRRPWDRYIGGPPYPALDGLLGAILKTYREFRACGEREWLAGLWEHVRLAIDHAMERYDRGDGVIHGPQPCTYDVEIEGPNSFIESLYLASLRAAEEMAKAVGDRESAKRYRARFRKGQQAADKLLWGGEYYVHRYDPETESVQAYGAGCHSDQLFGQWWAHSLGLGYALPRKHVREALASIMKYNFRQSFSGHQQFPRAYVRNDEAGILNCTWPKGGRPDTALLYSDEVWTGIEYEVAGALLFEGMIEEALAVVDAVRRRQDGRLRSPWNEVECGDHYVRAMSSWMLLEAAAGYKCDASRNLIEFGPRISPENFRCFFATETGWGQYSQRLRGNKLTAELSVLSGAAHIQELRLSAGHPERVNAKIGSTNISFAATTRGGQVILRFKELLTIEESHPLRISVG
ncbi:hypothetical protein HZA56_07440 [Candidatus Poribacteria bacterium]|nr:hypothetical protein [Candidatus Poribacteria bacterium]